MRRLLVCLMLVYTCALQAGTASSAFAPDIFNAKPQGAVGNGVNDDQPAIQTTYNAACNAVTTFSTTPTVFLPPPSVNYLIKQPIVLMCSGGQPRLLGPGMLAGGIKAVYNGPAIVVANGGNVTTGTLSAAHISLTTNLVTGAGNALTFASTASVVLDLNDVLGVQKLQPVQNAFNGLPQWGYEVYFTDADTAHDHPLWSSDGSADPNGVVPVCTTATVIIGACRAMGYLYVKGSDQTLRGALNVGGTEYTLSSGATTVTQGTSYKAELNFDGANINLYLGPTGGTITRVAQQVGTALTSAVTTVAVSGTALTFTRSAGSWITDGFKVDGSVLTSGFATGGNNGRFIISAVTATVMTCNRASGLVTEASGATVTFTGQISQRIDENNILAGDMPSWPYYANISTWQGAIDSPRISKIARNTAATYTDAGVKLTNDGANTLFLDTFSLNQFPAVTIQGHATQYPISQVDKAGVPNGPATSTAWLPLHIPGWGCCGGLYQISDLSILGSFDTIGILDEGAVVDIDHVQVDADVVAIKTTSGGTFGSVIRESNPTALLTPLMILGGISYIEGIGRNVGATPAYGLVVGGNGRVENYYFLPNTNSYCGIVLVQVGTDQTTTFDTINTDAENGGISYGLCFQISALSTVKLTNSYITPIGLPPIKILSVGPVGSLSVDTSFIQVPTGVTAVVDDSEATDNRTTGTVTLGPGNFYSPSVGFSAALLPAGVTPTNGGFMGFSVPPTSQTVPGTSAGTFVWSESWTANKKVVDVNLLAYENTTGVAQTQTLIGTGMAAIGSVTTISGTCTGVLISATTVTLPSSMGATQTGLCEAVGY